MAHLVRHRTPAGDTVTSEVADLEEAVALVERLRNEELAEDVRVFAEVPLRFQTYVRVSVAADAAASASEDEGTAPGDEAPASPAAETPPAEAPAAPVPPPPGVLAPVRVEAPSADADELVDVSQADNRRGLFHRS